jgi:hypothetical protein
MRLREFATREDAAATVAQKTATSGAKQIAGKIASKALPGVGTALGAREALRRWRSGDKSGAVISALAAVGYLVPGPAGWVLGGGMDAYDTLRETDLKENNLGGYNTSYLELVVRSGKTMKGVTPQQALAELGKRVGSQDPHNPAPSPEFTNQYLSRKIKPIKNIRERDSAATPQAKNIMHQIRRQYPQARSDHEALLLAVMAMQDADRRDIGRLDHENDQEEADIDRLDQEIADIERDIKPQAREALNPSLSFETQRYRKNKGVYQ